MRNFFRPAVAILFVLGLCSGRAFAATTADQLVALSRAGLEDEILIALIETDGSRFQLTADDLLELYRQGLSNKVIRAMQETARKPAVVATAPGAQPAEPPATEPAQIQAPPARPIVNVHQNVTQHVEVPPARTETRTVYQAVPIAVPVYVSRPVAPKPEPPVYWGFGGQRRPDSWDDRPVTKDKPDR